MAPPGPGAREAPHEKTGYRIARSVIAMVREAVEAGEARSQNELVGRALRRELRAMRQRRLYEAYARTAADSAFVDGMVDEASAWTPALGDGLAEQDA